VKIQESLVLSIIKIAGIVDNIKITWKINKNNKQKFIDILTPWINRQVSNTKPSDRANYKDFLRKIIKDVTNSEIELLFTEELGKLIEVQVKKPETQRTLAPQPPQRTTYIPSQKIDPRKYQLPSPKR